MDKTIKAYAKQHKAENKNHRVWVGMNFTYCETCKDHTHYYRPGEVIQHNADYSVYNFIKVQNNEKKAHSTRTTPTENSPKNPENE